MLSNPINPNLKGTTLKPIDQLNPNELKDLLFYTTSSGESYPLSKITILDSNHIQIGNKSFTPANPSIVSNLRDKLLTYEAYKLMYAQSTITDKASQISEEFIENKLNAKLDEYDKGLGDFLESFVAKVNSAFTDANSNFKAINSKLTSLERSISKFSNFANETDLSSIKQTIKSNIDELAPTKQTLADITSTLQRLFDGAIIQK